MTGTSYRLTIKPMVPGAKADPKNFKNLESMPVRSIITSPANGTKLPAGTREVKLRGASWAGDFTVRRVDISTDYGATWHSTKLEKGKNQYDWQRWTGSVKLPSRRLLRDLGARDRFTRPDAAACGAELESGRLRRQSDASRRGVDRRGPLRHERRRWPRFIAWASSMGIASHLRFRGRICSQRQRLPLRADDDLHPA